MRTCSTFFQSWFSGIGTEIRAVLLTLFVTIVWMEYRDWRKTRAERQRIASMVVAEILNQRAFIVHVGSIANYLVAQNTWTTRTDLVRLMPPPPLVFTAMVDRLPVLGAVLSGNVVAFYDTLDRARTFALANPTDALQAVAR